MVPFPCPSLHGGAVCGRAGLLGAPGRCRGRAEALRGRGEQPQPLAAGRAPAQPGVLHQLRPARQGQAAEAEKSHFRAAAGECCGTSDTAPALLGASAPRKHWLKYKIFQSSEEMSLPCDILGDRYRGPLPRWALWAGSIHKSRKQKGF